MKFKKILMPTDFSESSRVALNHALFLAEQHGATLDLLHVVVLHNSDPFDLAAHFPDPDEIAQRLQQVASSEMKEILAKRQNEKLDIKEVQRRSVAAGPAIVEYAAEEEVDLIIMGAHGRRGFRRFFLGSVAEEVVRLAPCPVLTLHGEKQTKLRRIEKIVVPMDFSRHSVSALRAAKELAMTYGSRVYIVHVLEPVMEHYVLEPIPTTPGAALDLRQLADKAREGLDRMIEEAGGPQVEFERVVLGGPAGPTIVQHADEIEADLLVIATHGHTGLEHFLLGSVAEKVVRLANCPVLTLKSASTKSTSTRSES